MNNDGNFHSTGTTTSATNEVVSSWLVQLDEVLAITPVSCCSFYSAIFISCLVHFKHIILEFLVPEGYVITNIERLVVSPISVVDSRVPSLIGTDNVVGGCCRIDAIGGTDDEDEDEDVDEGR